MTDLYETLGVSRDAPRDEIKRAYRRKARETHPDAGGDAERFGAVELAHRILSDEETRKRYDDTGDFDDRPDTVEAQALSLIGGMVEHLLNDESAVHKDLIDVMRRTLTDQLGQAQAEQRKGEAYLKRVEKMRGRFKGGRGAPLLDKMVAQRLEQVKATLAVFGHRLAVCNAAMTLLSDVSFDFEKITPATPVWTNNPTGLYGSTANVRRSFLGI